jgi:hypothetical protein
MKIRSGFVSNSSSSSFICLGVEDEFLINQLIEAEGIVKNEEGYYDNEGYGEMEGKVVMFYGNSFYWQAAGLGEGETIKILETNTLKEARKIFVKKIKAKLNIDISEKNVKLCYGEASSE